MKINILKSVVISCLFVVFQGAAPETAGGIDYDMVFVEGGIFRMGASAEQGDAIDCDEKPLHVVSVKNFYIGKYEVTQAQWRAIMGTNPSYFNGNNLPVEKVSWYDVQNFINKLNEMTGKKFRLPTEAEWEYAARGGKESIGYKYSGSDVTNEIAWCSTNSNQKTHKVGSIPFHNELGIFDMSGNVMEWCEDWYGVYKGQSYTNPKGPVKGLFRVVRGGSWCVYPENCRNAKRYNANPRIRQWDIGFRLAMDAD